MRSLAIFSLALCAAFVVHTSLANKLSTLAGVPAFGVGITQKGLDYGISVMTPWIEADVPAFSMQDFAGSEKVPVIGSVHYTVNQLKVGHFKLGHAAVSLQPAANAITIQTVQLSVQMTFAWSFKGPLFIKGSGTGTISLGAGTFAVQLQLGESNGKPKLTPLNSYVQLGNFDMRLSGGNNWLLNLLLSAFKSRVRSGAEKSMSKEITATLLDKSNFDLAEIPTQLNIGTFANVDFSLTGTPTVGADYLGFPSLGYVYSPSQPRPSANAVPTPNYATFANVPMVELFVSEYMMNSASQTAAIAGVMSFEMNPSNMPSDFPFKLSTTTFQNFFPALYSAYPDLPMKILVSPMNATGPVTRIHTGGINSTVTLNMDFFVLKDGQSVPVFTLGVPCNLVGQPVWNGVTTTLGYKVTSVDASLFVVRSNIGSLNVFVVNFMFKTAISGFGVTMLNGYLAQGAPLPLFPGVTLENPAFLYNNGYFTIIADVKYKYIRQ